MHLSYKAYGKPDARCLVLLHGLLGSRDNWHTFAVNHSDTYHIIVPDLVNHGASPHVDSFDYRSMAMDVVSLLDDLDVCTSGFIGHSMGGKVAMEIALSHAERINALVVEDMVPGKTSPRYLRYLELLKQIDLSRISTRRDAEAQLESDVEDRMVRLFLLKNLARAEVGGYRWRANLDSIASNYDHIWAGLEPGRTYTGPSLFVRGGESDTMPDSRISEILSFFPAATIETIPDAGHWVHALYPDRFDELVDGFLYREFDRA